MLQRQTDFILVCEAEDSHRVAVGIDAGAPDAYALDLHLWQDAENSVEFGERSGFNVQKNLLKGGFELYAQIRGAATYAEDLTKRPSNLRPDYMQLLTALVMTRRLVQVLFADLNLVAEQL